MTDHRPLVERVTGPSGDQVWWRLRVTLAVREVWQMIGVTSDADLAKIVAQGVASNDWHWTLKDGLSVVFRHEADALKAAELFT